MKNISVQPNISLRKAMKALSQSGQKCLVIIDKKNTLLGTLTDGDVRKAILKGADINSTIENIYQSKPLVLEKNKFRPDEVKQLFAKNKFDLIPVVDKKGELKNILYKESILNNGINGLKKKLYVPVIIMAGGKGTRLEPFTKILPKPLIPVHEKPIIEHIIEKFTEIGCTNFHLTVNYKSKILKAYFEELHTEYQLNFVEEDEPLGTAGSLRLLDHKFINKPFFVTNCDIIIKADYSNLYSFHKQGGYDITLVASAKEYVIPYGTCELNSDGYLSHINEKPKYNFLINTGLYVLNPDVLELIPEKKIYHITNLIKDAKNKGKKVGVYPIDDDSWIDVGQWTEYQKTIARF